MYRKARWGPTNCRSGVSCELPLVPAQAPENRMQMIAACRGKYFWKIDRSPVFPPGTADYGFTPGKQFAIDGLLMRGPKPGLRSAGQNPDP